MNNNKHLTHWGILGMRWGIRRGSKGGSSSSDSPDHTRAVALKKKKISQMSNEEIRTVVTRIQLEKQYKDLKKQNISKGQKFVSETLSNVGKQVVSALVNSLVKVAMRRAAAAAQAATGKSPASEVIDGLLLEEG